MKYIVETLLATMTSDDSATMLYMMWRVYRSSLFTIDLQSIHKYRLT